MQHASIWGGGEGAQRGHSGDPVSQWEGGGKWGAVRGPLLEA